MSHLQFHCTGRVYLDLHGLVFETSICYWQDQPGSPTNRGTDSAPQRKPSPSRSVSLSLPQSLLSHLPEEARRRKEGEGGEKRAGVYVSAEPSPRRASQATPLSLRGGGGGDGQRAPSEGTSTTSRHCREVTGRVEDVPKEWRIWGTGEKIGQSLFPWVRVRLVRDYVEINTYALLRLINVTRTLGKGTSQELSALRAMVMQNRVVLDLLAAPQGGVCKIIGQTCCTFIPDENGDGGSIHTALSDLDTLQQYVERQTPGGSQDWLSWLTTGTWWQVLLKVLGPPGVILLLFCLFFSCIVPCLRKIMTNVFISAFYHYTLVQGGQEGETEDQI
uniref:Uncharacterized protein n=1 Tax=Amphilophus citrinellus TaxID=61819 RepID=A0A3Q0RNF8_AMPCI